MGFYTEEAPVTPRVAQQAVIPDKPDPTLPETVAAAFRQDNVITNVVRTLANPVYQPEPDHNPLDVIRGTPYEAQHLDRFVASRSMGETRAIMGRIDQEEKDRKILDASGFPGFVAQVGAGMLDPTIALPGGAIYRGVKGGQLALRSAASVGAMAAVQTAAQEAILQNTQETRSLTESGLSIGTATLLGGFLGAGASALLTRAERQVMEDGLAAARRSIDAHAAGVAEAAPAGAAAADTRSLELVNHGLGFTDRLSPLRRVFSAESDEAKRITADLTEAPYRFTANEQGVATSQGPSVERLMRIQLNGTRAVVGDELGKLFADYRFGAPDTTLPGVRAQFERFQGSDGGKMTRGEFNRAVSEALMLGDRHDIPQVEQAAQLIRQKVFEPWADRAEKVIPGFKRNEAESYFPHYWNKELIRARRPEFVNRITEHYTADQTKKAAAKERLTWLNAQLRSWQDQIKKLDARFTRAEEKVSGLEKRTSERGMEANATEVRAETVEERHGRIADEAAQLDEAIGLLEELAPNNPTVAPILRRTEAMLETRSGQHDVVGAVADEARRAERRNFKRLDVLKDRLSNAEQRKALIEEYQAAAQQAHDAVRMKIEEEIGAWEGKSASEAKAAIKAKDNYAKQALRMLDPEAPRLTSADDVIDRAVKRIIESDRDLSVQELRSRANETVDRILGSPDGRLPYDMGTGGPQIGFRENPDARGSLAAREFKVSNEWAKDWLEDDVDQVIQLYLRTMVPDVLIAERFGDVNMSDAFRRIQDDYAKRIDATKAEKDRVRLRKERDVVIERVAAFRDRLRGTYGWSAEASMQNMARYANVAKNVNNLTSMGVSAISSLPDLAGAVFRYGFGAAFRDGWTPFFRGLVATDPEWQQFKGQMRALGIGVETAINARQHAFHDVMDVYRPQSRWERVLQGTSDKFFIANLLAPLTDAQKTIASHVAVSEILRATEAAAAGKATKKQIANLAESGIDLQMAARITDQFGQKGGLSDKGVRLPNLADWTDRSAADALAGAVGREVDMMVITPGQEKPLWMSRPVVSLLGQFKSFTASATERILIANLQRRDANTLQGLVASLSLGMMSYKLNSFFGGQDTSERPQDWFKEGMSRAGILGWMEEGNALASKVSRGGIDVYRLIGADKPASRFVSRSAVDVLLGPTAGKLKDAFQITGSAASRDWTEADTKALRRLSAGQNLFYLRGLLNKVEETANAKLGIQ